MAAPERSAVDSGTVKTAGPLLRMWRTNVLSMSVRQMAAAVYGSASGVSQWESDVRSVDRKVVHAIRDLASPEERDMGQLLDRAGTPSAFPASRRWEHNFLANAPGAFVWIRSGDPNGETKITARWGILEFVLAAPIDVAGVVVAGPGAVTNPRLVIDLEPAGWCDFFVGTPSPKLGIEIVEAVPLFRATTNRTYFSGFFARHLRSNLPQDRKLIADAVGVTEALVVGVMDGQEHEASDSPDADDVAEPQSTSMLSFRKAREAYGLSQQEVADMVSDLTGWSVSQDSISRLERGLPVNNVLLAAAVDRALGADGRLASVPYRPVVDGKIEVVFPAWWVGPIWIQIDGAAAATLTWTPYVKRVQVDGDSTTLHTRCADPAIPLRIEFAPTSVKGMIGLGRRDDAFDINERWQPASVDSLNQVMHAGEELALRIFKRSRSTLTALVRARRQKVR